MRSRRRGLEMVVVGVAMALVGVRVVWQARDAMRAPCPPGFAEDSAREARVLALVGRDPEARDAARNAGGRRGRLCFGAIAIPVVTDRRALLLSRDAGDAETAARVAHLDAHLGGDFAPVDGFDRRTPCATQVDAALHAEAASLDLELGVRTRLHVRAPVLRLGFERAWAAAPDETARRDVAYRWLVAHPHGGEGTDGLADAYAARCAAFVRGAQVR